MSEQVWSVSSEEDLDRLAFEYQDAQYEAWEREHAEVLVDEAFQVWAADRREDGESDSFDDFLDYLESQETFSD